MMTEEDARREGREMADKIDRATAAFAGMADGERTKAKVLLAIAATENVFYDTSLSIAETMDALQQIRECADSKLRAMANVRKMDGIHGH